MVQKIRTWFASIRWTPRWRIVRAYWRRYSESSHFLHSLFARFLIGEDYKVRRGLNHLSCILKILKIGFRTQNESRSEKKENINASFNKNSNNAESSVINFKRNEVSFHIRIRTWANFRNNIIASVCPSTLYTIANSKTPLSTQPKKISANQRFNSRANQYTSYKQHQQTTFSPVRFVKWFTI